LPLLVDVCEPKPQGFALPRNGMLLGKPEERRAVLLEYAMQTPRLNDAKHAS
jgi:hypothetical protein